MKRLLSLIAAMLIFALLLVPFVTASASSDEDGVSDETVTASAEEFDYSSFTPIIKSITDGAGKSTKAYSSGFGCGFGGLTLFVNHVYNLNFDYTVTQGDDEAPVPELKITGCDTEIKDRYISVQGGTVTVNAGNEPFSFTVIVMQNGEETENRLAVSVAKFKVEFTDLLLATLGFYALYTAISGRGSMFRNDFIKEGKEQSYKKTIRVFAVIIAVGMLAGAAVSIFCVGNDKLVWLRYLLFGIAIASLIASMIYSSRMTDKEKRAKAMVHGGSNTGSSAAAFEFDDDEPTLDDVLAKLDGEKNESEGENK